LETQAPAKTACSNCGKLFSPKMRLCPFCGAERKAEPLNRVPLCPRCACELEEEAYRKAELAVCPRCKGIWLATADFRHLTSERDVYSDDSIPEEYRRRPLPRMEPYLPCPVCRELMNRRNFRRISGVLIDVCRDHGVWLDAGELGAIRSFVANGGLEESQDRDIVRNAEEIKRIAGRVKDVELMEKVLHIWNFKRWLFRGFWVR